MRLMGFTEEAIKEELAQDEPDLFELWPEHLPVWRLFLSISHQWLYQPMCSRPYGLDYPSVWSVLRGMFPRKQRKKLFRQLQYIEAGALKAWPKKST